MRSDYIAREFFLGDDFETVLVYLAINARDMREAARHFIRLEECKEENTIAHLRRCYAPNIPYEKLAEMTQSFYDCMCPVPPPTIRERVSMVDKFIKENWIILFLSYQFIVTCVILALLRI